MHSDPTVFVLDGDAAIRHSLTDLLGSVSIRTETFASASEFLDAYDPDQPGCVVLELCLAGRSGTALQDTLRNDRPGIPLIFLTDHADVPTTVRVMLAGALDVFEKPFSPQVMLERINEGLVLDGRRREEHARRTAIRQKLAVLTLREREVMQCVLAGMPNGHTADRLNVTCKTVEFHRANMMHKLQIDNVAALVRLALESGDDAETVSQLSATPPTNESKRKA